MQLTFPPPFQGGDDIFFSQKKIYQGWLLRITYLKIFISLLEALVPYAFFLYVQDPGPPRPAGTPPLLRKEGKYMRELLGINYWYKYVISTYYFMIVSGDEKT